MCSASTFRRQFNIILSNIVSFTLHLSLVELKDMYTPTYLQYNDNVTKSMKIPSEFHRFVFQSREIVAEKG